MRELFGSWLVLLPTKKEQKQITGKRGFSSQIILAKMTLNGFFYKCDWLSNQAKYALWRIVLA